MARLMAWCVPAGVFWTRDDATAVLVDQVRVLWLEKNRLMAELEQSVARYKAAHQ